MRSVPGGSTFFFFPVLEISSKNRLVDGTDLGHADLMFEGLNRNVKSVYSPV